MSLFILLTNDYPLSNMRRVYFRDFGSFVKEKRKSKKVCHPKTSQIITIPKKTTVDFNPSKSLIQKIS